MSENIDDKIFERIFYLKENYLKENYKKENFIKKDGYNYISNLKSSYQRLLENDNLEKVYKNWAEYSYDYFNSKKINAENFIEKDGHNYISNLKSSYQRLLENDNLEKVYKNWAEYSYDYFNSKKINAENFIEKDGHNYISNLKSSCQGLPENDNLEKVYKSWAEYICNSFLEDNFINGKKTNAEDFIVNSLKTINQNWLNRLYLEKITSSKIKIGILHTISHIDYEKVHPIGQSIALMGLTDPDDEVIEYSIKVFENWECKDAIPLLKGRQIKKKWLQEYLEDVVEYLEEL